MLRFLISVLGLVLVFGTADRLLAQSATVPTAVQPSPEFASPVVASARAQIGVTTIYDGAYVGLDYPMGDLDRSRGVCSDVVIRALRDAHNIDLQVETHRDMKANFAAYPTIWGLRSTDRNIDHRRVLNLRVLFERHATSLPISTTPDAYLPGDIVTWMLPGNLPHMGIVSDQRDATGTRPLIIHNIGRGTQEEDMLYAYEITGHYRIAAGDF